MLPEPDPKPELSKQINKNLNRVLPITQISSKKYYNAFNQSSNLIYKINDIDTNTIAARMVMYSKLCDYFEYLPLSSRLYIPHLPKLKIKINKDARLIGIFKGKDRYTLYTFYQEDVTVCEIYQKDQCPIQFQQELNKLEVKLKISEQEQISNIGNSSFHALIRLNSIVNKQNKLKINNILDLKKQRAKLAQIYLSEITEIYGIRNWSDWHKLTQINKKQYLFRVNPLTPQQFLQATKMEEDRMESQLAELMKFSIETYDSTLAKVILRTNIPLTGGAYINQSQNKISFVALIQKKLQTCTKSEQAKQNELQIIKKALTKYGYTDMITNILTTKKNLKKQQNHDILLKISKAHRVDIKLFESFLNLLKSHLHSKITGIMAAVSGQVQMTAGSTVDSLLSKALGKAPYVGSILSSAYDSFVFACQKARKQNLSRYFSSSSQIEQIIQDYSIRIIAHYSQQILNPIPKSILKQVQSFLNQKIKQFSIKFPIKYIFKVQGVERNYTIDWQILCNCYMGQFLGYLVTQEAVESFVNNSSFGIYAARRLFEYNKISKQDLTNITSTQKYSQSNCYIFAKLTSYINNIHRYPKSIAFSQDFYWFNSKLQSNKVGFNVRAVVFGDHGKIVIGFYVDQGEGVGLSAKSGQFCGIKVSESLIKSYNNFIDNAFFIKTIKQSTQQSEQPTICFPKLLHNLTKPPKTPTIYLTGFGFGGVLCALTRLLLIHDYDVKVENIISYTYGEDVWCYKNQVGNVLELFSSHYQVHLEEVGVSGGGGKEFCYFGNRVFLRSQKICTQKTLYDYIHILQSKQFNKTKQKQQQTQQTTIAILPQQHPIQPTTQLQMQTKSQEKFNIKQITFQTLLKIISKGDFPTCKKLLNISSDLIKNIHQSQLPTLKQNKTKMLQQLSQYQLQRIFRQQPFDNKTNKGQIINKNYPTQRILTFKILKYILQKKLTKNTNLLKILCLASQFGDLSLVKYLIEQCRIQTNQSCYSFNWFIDSGTLLSTTPLISAMVGIVRCNIQERDISPQLQIVRYLVEIGQADVNFSLNHTNKQQKTSDVLIRKATIGTITPIMLAIDMGNLQLIKYLVSKGCNLFTATHRELFNNWNALSLSISPSSQIFHTNKIRKDQLSVIRYLVDQKGFKVGNLKLPDTQRQIYIDAKVALFLIQRGLSPNSTIQILGHLIDTLLLFFVRRNNYIMVQYLLEKGADPNIKTTGYEVGTALHCVSCNFNSDNFKLQLNLAMLKLLLKYGGDLLVKVSGFVAWFKNSESHRLNKTPLDFLLQLEDKQPHVRKYLDILRLQNRVPNQSLTFESFKKTSQHLLQNGFDYYTICSYFVSEFIQLQNKIKISTNIPKPIKQLKQKLTKLKPQFFSGTHKLQQYNKAIQYMFSYYNAKRFDEVLNICEKNGNDGDFLFLKAMVYLQLANGYDKQKYQFYKEKVYQVLGCLEGEYQKVYILGDLAYLENNKQQAITYYYQSYQLNKKFNYPKLKLLTLILQYGLKSKTLTKILKPSPQQIFNQIFNEVSKHTLPFDLQAMMRDIHERKENINAFKKQITSQEQNFVAALRQTFNVDVKVLKYNIQKLLPEKLYNIVLTYTDQSRNQKLNIKKLFKQIDYAYAILSQGYTLLNRITHSSVPDRSDSQFFKKLNQLILKLETLKDGVQNKCYSKRDFKREEDQQFCIMLIDSLIDYYEDYIDRVVRSYQQDQDTNYVKYFFQTIGKRLDVQQRIQVFTENKLQMSAKQKKSMRGPFLMKQVASQHLTIQVPSGDQLYGTHKVIVLPTTGSNQIFYKYEPYAPGIQYAVGSIYKLILPNSTPDTMLLKLTDGKKSGLYLASKAITGSNFAQTINQIDYVNLIDMKNFSGLFISSLLVCTGDAKPDNFVMHFNYNKNELVSTELISIDNDIAFYRSKLKTNPESKNLYSDMLNILYLMPQMDQPVSPYLREYLNKVQNQPEIIVAKWLGSLYIKNQHYLSMKGFTQQDLKTLKLPIKLPSGTACTIYSILTKLTHLLKTSTITHTQIFRTLSPSLSYFYTKSRDNTSMVNSLKNLYVAAGADPAILASLYSLDKIRSSNAWNTMSASKRRDVNQFNKLFNSQIVVQAENFIGMIDFAGKDEYVINAIRENLYFVKNVVLHNIDDSSYKLMMKQPTFTNIQYQKIIQSPNIQKKPNPYPTHTNQNQNQPYSEISSIRQLLTYYPKLTTNYQLISLLTQKNISINQPNQKGETFLFDIVYRIMDRTIDEKYGVRLIKILLDCGIDTKIKDKYGNGILDIAINVPYLVLTIFQHKPVFFYQLLKNNLYYQHAKTIAKSINSDACIEMMDSELVGNENSILRQILSNKEMKNIAMVILKKQENKGLCIDQRLLGVFVENYQDGDVDLLGVLLGCGFRGISRNVYGLYPADIALKMHKYHLATMLLNQGGLLTKNPQNPNLTLLLKATTHTIKLDINDIKTKYDLSKTNIQGDTLLHIMARRKDKDILIFQEEVRMYGDQKSKFDGKTVREIAVQGDFVELMEVLYEDREGQGVDWALYEGSGHKLSKNQLIRSLSKLLKQLGFSISLHQARNGIDFSTKIAQNGNTALQKLLNLHLTQKQQSILQKITTVLQNSHKNYINQTSRPDGNTILHLLLRSRQVKYAYKLWCQYHQNIDLAVTNAQGLTVIQYSVMVIGQNVFGREGLGGYEGVLRRIREIQLRDFEDVQSSLSETDKELQSVRNLINVVKINKK